MTDRKPGKASAVSGFIQNANKKVVQSNHPAPVSKIDLLSPHNEYSSSDVESISVQGFLDRWNI